MLPYSVSDAQSRTGSGAISLTVIGPPNPAIGPDVTVGEVTDVPYWGTNAGGTIAAYSVGTTSLNEGDYPVMWINSTGYAPDFNPTDHPVISQNMYRLKSYGTYSRFEHLGQSWLKHGFVSENYGTGCQPSLVWRYSLQNYQDVGGAALGVNCLDTYGGSLNGSQGNLGPKNIVNATTGFSPFQQGGGTGDATISERLQVPVSDVASQPVGTRFFVDAWYCTQDVARSSSARASRWPSTRPALPRGVRSPPRPSLHRRQHDNTQFHSPAIAAWQIADPTVTMVTVDHDDTPNPGTGFQGRQRQSRLPRHDDPVANTGLPRRRPRWAGSVPVRVRRVQPQLRPQRQPLQRADALGRDRQRHHFSCSAVALGRTLQQCSMDQFSVGEHADVRNPGLLGQQNANALRWSSLYNFGFTANVAHERRPAAITLFKPGAQQRPGSINANGVPVPAEPPPCGSADFNCDGDTGTDADIEAFFACLAGNCPAPPCTSTADFNGDGDVGTDADIEAFFRVLAGGTC